jgi:hypothetical protein
MPPTGQPHSGSRAQKFATALGNLLRDLAGSKCLRVVREGASLTHEPVLKIPPNFCLTSACPYDLIPERAPARIRLAASITAAQNGRFIEVPERSSCLGLKGDDIRGHRACVCFACARNRIIRPSNLFDRGAFPRGRVAFSSRPRWQRRSPQLATIRLFRCGVGDCGGSAHLASAAWDRRI